MAIELKVKNSILEYLDKHLSDLINRKKEEFDGKKNITYGDYKPFHEPFITPSFKRTTSFERSFSTGFGNTFEHVAVEISNNYHDFALGHAEINGEIDINAQEEIINIKNDIDENNFRNNKFPSLIKQVNSQKNSKKSPKSGKIISDLYIKSGNKNYFIEMKAPGPNKDQCLAALEKLLRIHAMKNRYISKKGSKRENIQGEIITYFTFSYNPFYPDKYNWTFVKNYTDLKNEVRIAEEFWDLIGGPGTYGEVLQLYEQVGKKYRDKIKKLID